MLAFQKASPMIEEVKHDAQESIRLTNSQEQVLQQLIALAEPLPEYEILLYSWYRRNNGYKHYWLIRRYSSF